MSSSDMLHMFRDYMDSYDQLRLIRMSMRTKLMTMVNGQWSWSMVMVMVMVMIMMILGCRVSADAAQLLATKFSSSTCGSGFTYTAGRLFRFDYQYVCTQCDYEDPQSIEVDCSKWPHVDRGEEKLLFRIPLFWP